MLHVYSMYSKIWDVQGVGFIVPCKLCVLQNMTCSRSGSQCSMQIPCTSKYDVYKEWELMFHIHSMYSKIWHVQGMGVMFHVNSMFSKIWCVQGVGVNVPCTLHVLQIWLYKEWELLFNVRFVNSRIWRVQKWELMLHEHSMYSKLWRVQGVGANVPCAIHVLQNITCTRSGS